MAPLRPSIAIAAVALSLLAVTTTAASAQENLVGRRDDGATTTGLGGRSYTYLLSAIRSLPIATMSTRASGLVIAPSRPRVAPAQSALECQQPGPSSWPSEPAGTISAPNYPPLLLLHKALRQDALLLQWRQEKYGRLGLRETCGSIESTSGFTKRDLTEWITAAELAIS